MNITDFRDTQKQFLEINHRDNRITFVFTANMLMLTVFSSFGELDFAITMDTRETNALKEALGHFFDESDGRATFIYDKETFNSPTAPELSISTTNWGEPFEEGVVVTCRTGHSYDEPSFSVGSGEAETILHYLKGLTFSLSLSVGGLYKK